MLDTMKRKRRRSNEEEDRIWVLGRYNAERARGIVHTEEWNRKMAAEQARFDERKGN